MQASRGIEDVGRQLGPNHHDLTTEGAAAQCLALSLTLSDAGRPMAASASRVFVVGTFDTKARELGYLARCLRDAGLVTCMVDVGGGAAYGNTNEIVLDMAREVLPVVKHTPVRAGVNGSEPFVLWDACFDRLERLGFVGVRNFPTVGLFDGQMRQQFNECEATVRRVRNDVIMICLGGPIAEPEHAAHMPAHCPRCHGCHGFYGASSMERLPTERALTEHTRHFTSLRVPAARSAG